MSILRKYSIAQGLIVPDFFHVCECYSDYVQKTIAKRHQVKEVNDLVAEYFDKIMSEVETYERDLLDVLNLPPLNVVRVDAENKGVDDPYVAPLNWQRRVDSVLVGLQESLEEEDLYPRMAQSGLAVGLAKTQEKIIRAAPASMREQLRVNALYVGSNTERTLARILNDGTKRIRDKTLRDFRDLINREVLQGVSNNQSFRYVARQIHRKVGEGRAWDWLRFVRSEIVLAYERAYDLQADHQGINYDEWSTSATPCEICSPLDGRVWVRGEGPVPVESTHSNCYCIRVPLFTTNKTIQDRWIVPSIYGKSFDMEIAFFKAMHEADLLKRNKALSGIFGHEIRYALK